MKISKKALRQLVKLMSPKSDNSAWIIGSKYFIRTVTMSQVGEVVAVTKQEIVLKNASWIANTGRFSDTLKSGDFSEIEPFPQGKVIVGRGAIIDAVEVIFELPSVQV